MKIRPIPNTFRPETKREIYINEIWSKYPSEQRNEMSKLLKKDGPTFEKINEFETFNFMKVWQNIKKEMGW